MANSDTVSATYMTAEFVISYPKLLNPEAFLDENRQPKGLPVYSFEAISTPESLAEWKRDDRKTNDFVTANIEKECVRLAKEKFGEDFDVVQAVKLGALSWPFKSGDLKADEKGEKADHYRGKKYWRAKAMSEINGSPNSPALYFENNGLVQLHRGTLAGDRDIGNKFYGGAICTAEVTAVAGTSGPNKYVTLYVNSVVFERDGDRLGGGSGMERFRGVRGGKTDYDPSEGMEAGLDDEIPF